MEEAGPGADIWCTGLVTGSTTVVLRHFPTCSRTFGVPDMMYGVGNALRHAWSGMDEMIMPLLAQVS